MSLTNPLGTVPNSRAGSLGFVCFLSVSVSLLPFEEHRCWRVFHSQYTSYRGVSLCSGFYPALVHSCSKCLNGPRTFICRGCRKVIVELSFQSGGFRAGGYPAGRTCSSWFCPDCVGYLLTLNAASGVCGRLLQHWPVSPWEAGVGGWVRQLKGGVGRGGLQEGLFLVWGAASHCPVQLSCGSVCPLLASYQVSDSLRKEGRAP